MENNEILRKGTLGIVWTEPLIKAKNESSCAVLIPVYKSIEKLSKFEQASISRTIEILGKKYEIMLVCGYSFDCEEYNREFSYDFSYIKCSDAYFKSQKSYSDLCEEWKFYDSLSNYEYILICQPDAWVFEDKLEHFISLGYDYIGSVHMLRANGNGGKVGNGGFSLRKTKKFSELCKETDFGKFGYFLFEDCAFCIKLKDKLNIADLATGFEFGWQEQPQVAYQKTGKLPFGCHNPMKNNWNFWRNYIKISDKAFDENEARVLSDAENFSIRGKYTRGVLPHKKKIPTMRVSY